MKRDELLNDIVTNMRYLGSVHGTHLWGYRAAPYLKQIVNAILEYGAATLHSTLRILCVTSDEAATVLDIDPLYIVDAIAFCYNNTMFLLTDRDFTPDTIIHELHHSVCHAMLNTNRSKEEMAAVEIWTTACITNKMGVVNILQSRDYWAPTWFASCTAGTVAYVGEQHIATWIQKHKEDDKQEQNEDESESSSGGDDKQKQNEGKPSSGGDDEQKESEGKISSVPKRHECWYVKPQEVQEAIREAISRLPLGNEEETEPIYKYKPPEIDEYESRLLKLSEAVNVPGKLLERTYVLPPRVDIGGVEVLRHTLYQGSVVLLLDVSGSMEQYIAPATRAVARLSESWDVEYVLADHMLRGVYQDPDVTINTVETMGLGSNTEIFSVLRIYWECYSPHDTTALIVVSDFQTIELYHNVWRYDIRPEKFPAGAYVLVPVGEVYKDGVEILKELGWDSI